MKRVLVLLLMCLASTAMFAQKATALHWTPVRSDFTMTMSAVLVIDGEEVGAEALQLEIGIFDQDGVCRGAKLPKLKNGRYKYSPSIYGYAGYTYTCRVWDHNTDSERTDLTFVPDPENPLIWITNEMWGTSSNPYELVFTTGGSETMTLEKEIVGYGDPETNPYGNYYLIANPFTEEVAPTSENGFITDMYDLFWFNQAEQDEWRNFKVAAFDMLEPGKGYLYASSTGTTLHFVGMPLEAEMVEMELEYSDEAGDFPGWNLMGNPLASEAYVDRPFYYMDNSEDYIAGDAGSVIDAMGGLFVVATEPGQSVTFSVTPIVKTSRLSLNLIGNGSLVDRAIVNFGGSQLPKFQFNSDNTKLYIPMDDADYAIVSSEEMGELPVNFKASTSGSYTISVSSEEVSFGYLHLIDNMTGMDVDLLATPNYSFEASPMDYASRFRLVFATGNSDDNFAFYSNGSFVINNEGTATLQVVDVTGRILSSETINGCANVSVDAAKGVYMIRLINGENVKVQKVVVR